MQESVCNQEPPLARYVLQTSTGKWRRQTSASTSAPKFNSCSIHNSLDYTLWRAMYVSTTPTGSRGNGCETSVDAALKQIEEFESRHCAVSPRFPLLVLPQLGVNPLVGLLSGVPLYEIYAALIRIKEAHPQQSEHVLPLRLSLLEVYTACAELVPCMVSYEYVRQMLSSFAFNAVVAYDDGDGECAVPLSELFSYLVTHTFHPTLNRNVLALFRAFDPDSTGMISVATLTHSVVAAWAELNLFGILRKEWERMAAALQLTESIDLRVVDGAHLLTPQAACAVFCTSSLLYNSIESVDMSGSHTKATFYKQCSSTM